MKLRAYMVALAAFLVPTAMSAAQKHTPLFMYGFATSFNDSTVYFTEIQKIDDAWTDSKTGFLYSRDSYSYQLRESLQKAGVAQPTCVTFFDKKRKNVEKKYAELKKRYATKGRYDVKYLSAADFAYSAIEPDDTEKYSSATLKAEKAAAKKAKADAKKAKKEKKKANKH